MANTTKIIHRCPQNFNRGSGRYGENPHRKNVFCAILFLRIAEPRAIRCQLSDLMKTNMQTIPQGAGLVRYLIRKLHGNETGNSCDRRLFFFLGASRLVGAASPPTISIDKKTISSGTQGTPNGFLSTEFIHDTHRLSTRLRLTEKSNVTWFLFLRSKVDTMSSIRISYNATLPFEENMLIG